MGGRSPTEKTVQDALVPSEIPAKRDGGGQTARDRTTAMAEAKTGTTTENLGQREANLEMTTPVENNQPTCDMRPTQTEQEKLRLRETS